MFAKFANCEAGRLAVYIFAGSIGCAIKEEQEKMGSSGIGNPEVPGERGRCFEDLFQ